MNTKQFFSQCQSSIPVQRDSAPKVSAFSENTAGNNCVAAIILIWRIRGVRQLDWGVSTIFEKSYAKEPPQGCLSPEVGLSRFRFPRPFHHFRADFEQIAQNLAGTEALRLF